MQASSSNDLDHIHLQGSHHAKHEQLLRMSGAASPTVTASPSSTSHMMMSGGFMSPSSLSNVMLTPASDNGDAAMAMFSPLQQGKHATPSPHQQQQMQRKQQDRARFEQARIAEEEQV
jgi:hypothetical protein